MGDKRVIKGFLQRHPRACWRAVLVTAPVWLVLTLLLSRAVVSQPVPAPADAALADETGADAITPPPRPSIDQYAAVWSRSLRDRLIEPEPQPDAEPSEQDRGLRLTLLGTAVEGSRSFAMLRSHQGRVLIAELGSMLDSYRVQSIAAERVTLIRDGQRVDLVLPEALRRVLPESAKRIDAQAASLNRSSPAPAAGSSVSEPRAPLATLRLRDLSAAQFLGDTRLIPAVTFGGEPAGIRIDSIAEASPLMRAGLRPGDAIVSVDDEPLTRLQDLERLYDRLDAGIDHRWGMRRGEDSYTVQLTYTETHDEKAA
ncbi:MAG: PDZ domain-containing protein [Planctomycetes bacterium]|jgi:type II secretory pathway component PulC|nr:PDZ domain-containing protein [Planctomycetota bacterium]